MPVFVFIEDAVPAVFVLHAAARVANVILALETTSSWGMDDEISIEQVPAASRRAARLAQITVGVIELINRGHGNKNAVADVEHVARRGGDELDDTRSAPHAAFFVEPSGITQNGALRFIDGFQNIRVGNAELLGDEDIFPVELRRIGAETSLAGEDDAARRRVDHRRIRITERIFAGRRGPVRRLSAAESADTHKKQQETEDDHHEYDENDDHGARFAAAVRDNMIFNHKFERMTGAATSDDRPIDRYLMF